MHGFFRGVHGFFGGHAWFFGGVPGFFGGVCMVFCGCIGYNEIRSMSGPYASYWIAFLFEDSSVVNI